MAVTNIDRLSIKPERLDEWMTYFESLLPDLRAYDGCQGLEVYQNQDEPSNLIVVHRWDSKEHYRKYVDWREGTDVPEVVYTFMAEDATTAFCDKLNI